MADYWKSQARKFCDFCKCWIPDNKPSVQFHESGKRHKENVARRISEITKQSAKDQKESVQIDKEMKKMEEQALKAYMKDVEANPDWTSQRLLEEKQRKQEAEQTTTACTKEKELLQNEEQSVKATEKKWYEAKSDEGYTYYWHIETAESVWEPPTEGYVSVEEQEKLEKERKAKVELEKLRRKEQKKLQNEEIRAANEREEMKKRRLKEENHSEEEESTEPSTFIGPAMREDPLGAWTVVEKKVEEPIDLQLPEQEYIEIKVPDITEPEVKFKEKTITKLDEGGDEKAPSGFKKRKLNAGARFGNIRQRLNND